MLMARRNMMVGGAKLPYDAEVEFLESSGGQYIDTGVLSASSLEVVVDFVCDRGFVFGTYVSPYQFSIDTHDLGFWRIDGYGRNPSKNITRGKRHVVGIRNGPSTLDGIVVWNGDSQIFDSGSRMLLFRADAQSGLVGKIYSFLIRKNGDVIRDMIPVSFTNENGVSEGAMYDRSGVGGMNRDGSARNDGLYRNRGTGAFVIGPDK